ncbi:MAG: tetratricopeptide repeat protein [Candidatus Helarchaeota archaeon]
MIKKPRLDLVNRLKNVAGKEKIKILCELAGNYGELPANERIEFAEQAIDLSEKINDHRSKAEAYNHLGVAYNNLGSIQKSIDYFIRALKIMEQINDKNGIANSYVNIGQAYFYLENFNKSLEYFQKALKLREEIGDKNDISQSLLLIGNVKSKTEKYEEALDYFFKSMAIKKKIGDKRGISQIYNNLGNIYLEVGRQEEALEYRIEALQIDRELDDKWEIANSTYNIAEHYLLSKEYEKAYPYILESYELAKDLSNKGLIRDNLHNFSLYYELSGDYQKALKYQRDYSEIVKSMFSEELSEKIAEMQTKYETEKLEDMVVERTFELKKTIHGVIRTIALIVEARDPYTAGHQAHVADLAAEIAREMKLSNGQVEGVKMAGMIHDLGKIKVPVGILSKPSKLTDPEFEIIKTHPQVGFDLLKELEFPWPLAEMIMQHHEKMDGSGYPQGLKGNEIMLEARILAVADIVEAMSSHRPYRPALGIDKTLDQIKQDKGTLLDPKVVDACLRVFKGGYKFPISENFKNS